MKPSDDDLVRWMDDAMDPREAAAFESALDAPHASRAEKSAWQKTRATMLRSDALPPEYHRDADFLTSQILRGVAAEPRGESKPMAARAAGPMPSLARMFGLGATLTALAIALGVIVIRHNDGIPTEAEFVSSVIDARTSDPSMVSAYTFHTPDGRGSVIWVESPGFIPSDQRIR